MAALLLLQSPKYLLVRCSSLASKVFLSFSPMVARPANSALNLSMEVQALPPL